MMDVSQEQMGCFTEIEPFFKMFIDESQSDEAIELIFVLSQNSISLFFHCGLEDEESRSNEDLSLSEKVNTLLLFLVGLHQMLVISILLEDAD
jgi:hypothetical protein